MIAIKSEAAMVYSLQAFGYAERLCDWGLPQDQVEARPKGIRADVVSTQDVGRSIALPPG
jgi:hypothetical protein